MPAQLTSPKFSVIFPISERRQSGEFRAFTRVDGEMLVQRAWRSFGACRHLVEKVYFIYQIEDETRFDVAGRLREALPGVPLDTICLGSATSGPAETVARGVLQHGVGGRAIVCDIDHRLDLQPLMEAMAVDPAAALHVCVWPIKGENLKRWSVACLTRHGLIGEVAERQLPASSGTFFGVIGCYHFRDIAATAARCHAGSLGLFSDLFNEISRAGGAIPVAHLTRAEFFGDQERIHDIEQKKERFRGTVFCDVDGTILKHEDVPSYGTLPVVLPGSVEKLESWIADGYCVILCTARASEDEAALTRALHRLSVPFHRLVTGLPSGPRVVINDRKPYDMFLSQAMSLEIARNQGIGTLELPAPRRLNVLKRFDGGSFAETLLLEDHSARQFVRKRASKHHNLSAGYARLKSQYRTLSRFSHICEGIVPHLLGEQDDSHEYYYDMEFLGSHRPLSECPPDVATLALDDLLERFDQSVYCHRNRSPSVSADWFLKHLEHKIYAKIDALSDNAALRPLLTGDEVEIDGRPYPSIGKLMAEVTGTDALSYFAPQFLSLVHGDLTFQNIMVDSTINSVKAIDLESTDSLEAVELDLGKIFQSLHSQYDTWSLHKTDLCRPLSATRFALSFVPGEPDARLTQAVRDRWSDIIGCSRELVDIKGGFYLGLHLFRMVPFRLRVSEDQALYALATSIRWLSRSLDIARGRRPDRSAAPASLMSAA